MVCYDCELSDFLLDRASIIFGINLLSRRRGYNSVDYDTPPLLLLLLLLLHWLCLLDLLQLLLLSVLNVLLS